MRSKYVTKPSEIEDILNKCDVCYVGMVDQNQEPYVVALNYGYRDNCLYLHSAKTGRKIEILKTNNKVCVALSTDHLLRAQHEAVACSYAMHYRSVVIHGHVEFIEDNDQKMEALNIIMKHYTGHEFSYNLPAVREVEVYKVIIEKIQARQLG